MRSPTQVAALVAAFLLALLAVSSAHAARVSAAAEERLLAAMNGVRASYGLRPLRFDGRLRRAARSHSFDMVRRQYFAHGAFALRLGGFGVHDRTIGENLAWGTGWRAAATTIVSEWLASPPHRAVLLHAGFRRVGVGAADGPFAGLVAARVVTADFAGR
jgi:uncharacterized protein YkwD